MRVVFVEVDTERSWAVASIGPGFLAAVQWHPEFHAPGDTSVFDDGPMLQDFLRAARATRVGRSAAP